MRRVFMPVLVVLAVTLAGLAGCGSGGEGGTRGRGTSGHPGGGDEVVLQARTGGGLVAPQSRLAGLPLVSVYGDGRVITVGPTTQQFPGPALPNLQEFRLEGAGVQQIVAAARAAGLLDQQRPDYGEPSVTDMATTTIEVHAAGINRTVAVYALGFDDEHVGGLTANQRAARKRLSDALRVAGDAASLATSVIPGSQRRYDPKSLAVLVSPFSGVGPGTPTSKGLRWPLGDLSGAGQPAPFGNRVRCLLVTGADLRPVLDAARNADEAARWESKGNAYSLVFRPLLPDEHSCGDLRPR